MKKIMFLMMVCMLTMSVSAQYNNAMLNTPVDTTYFLNGELSGNWNYGATEEMTCGYRNHLGGMTMIVYKDSLMLDGHMYAIAYSKQYRNRKTVLLIDWYGNERDMAELVIVKRTFPSTWWSAMLCAPKADLKYKPEPVYYELYRVENHWLGLK